MSERVTREQASAVGESGGGGGDCGLHPAIAGMLKTLPPAGTIWEQDTREKWLEAMRNILSLVYRDDDGADSALSDRVQWRRFGHGWHGNDIGPLEEDDSDKQAGEARDG